ncbi:MULTISPECIES: DUF6351 family protein [Burkholderiaceae]|uniref:DUF6351 family protein n=1 Tax=Burkholderiaceae TaxID=119060 RepID=UPI001C614BAC|nr:DUF6351 family protein [Burkholderia contaminans]
MAAADHEVAWADAQLGRLRAVFSGGACDWSRSGVGQSGPDGSWLRYGETPATWIVLGP